MFMDRYMMSEIQRRSLAGETDVDIAKVLSISPITVLNARHKHFIYTIKAFRIKPFDIIILGDEPFGVMRIELLGFGPSRKRFGRRNLVALYRFWDANDNFLVFNRSDDVEVIDG